MGGTEKGTPETRKVRMLDQANQDVQEIEYFIAVINEQPLNAIGVSKAIRDTVRRIGIAPFAFKECVNLASKSRAYRQAPCLSYLIIYQVTNTEIIIHGVIHSARKSSQIKKLKNRK